MSGQFFVAVYMADRAYGGPEEGGWYYDTGELVRVCALFRNEQSAVKYAQRLNARLEGTLNSGRREVSSVLSEGRYVAYVDDGIPPPHFPETRPYYE